MCPIPNHWIKSHLLQWTFCHFLWWITFYFTEFCELFPPEFANPIFSHQIQLIHQNQHCYRFFSFLSASWLSHDSRLRVVCRVLWSMCLTWRTMSFRPLCSLTLAIALLHREHALSWCPVLFLILLVVNLTHVASHGSISSIIASQPGSLPCKRSDWFHKHKHGLS